MIFLYSDTQTSVYGEKLKQQVEDRLKFFETGEKPRKNVDVMEEAQEEAAQQVLILSLPFNIVYFLNLEVEVCFCHI